MSLCLGINLIKSKFRDTQIFFVIFQGYFEVWEALMQQDKVHPDLLTLIMANLKSLEISEFLNEAIAYVWYFI